MSVNNLSTKVRKLIIVHATLLCSFVTYAQQDTTEVLDEAVVATKYLSPVTVGGLELPLIEIPQSVSVVNPARIKEFNMTTIDEAMREIPGVTTIANGTLITKVDYLKVLPGSRWLIKGPSGAGKTTFLKALSGIWQYGTGTISLPDKNLIFLPQMSYLPISNLKSALCYPQSPDEFTNEICIRALRICRLEQYTDALEAEDLTWNKKLSPGEKQRLAFARCILLKPDYLFLDEATSAMDSKLEEYIFRTITEELKNTAIVSIAHRESMNVYHDNTLNIISQIDT